MKKILQVSLFVFFLFAPYAVKSQTPYAEAGISLGIVVKDLPASIQFYEEVLGLIPSRSFKVQEDMAQRTGLSNGVPFEVFAFNLTEAPDAPELKLMTFSEMGDHALPKHIQDERGVQYLTFQVRTLKPILERIKANKIPLLGQTPINTSGDRYFVLVQDPDGTFIELIGTME